VQKVNISIPKGRHRRIAKNDQSKDDQYLAGQTLNPISPYLASGAYDVVF
jgi:hypothetical protein